ncbi:mitochondrial serine/threonine protein phosphatase PP2C catalytic subunit Ptc4 [Schizosaccharomyces osmophilus]|uniref:Mitochondrial serine/threonine protein phosphatase PP2C catalytic subunit Ptc4 n=1 Tax=Schizosaccharomyces osmophilus TaxID=2545709 RepID=A0AAF0AWK6_9SCHI|nr:mitochondrial serine/threonine protein phosphatase PP2C catalytic subunit Ptc4 [Schizosaccharomyces osmophilus]WBW73787.1 mitochondrial serine/threonine protein phosphatase PP2C catalytic subunit Ptc4 [Schizosaccharomyces osmophilus]
MASFLNANRFLQRSACLHPSFPFKAPRGFGKCTTRNLKQYYTPASGPYLRVSMTKAPQSLGLCSARGDSLENQDRLSFGYLDKLKAPIFLNDEEAPVQSLSSNNSSDANFSKGSGLFGSFPNFDSPFVYGIFDGHGGVECSEFLSNHLGHIIERQDFSRAEELLQEARSLGGYMFSLEPPFSLASVLKSRDEDMIWRARLYYSFLEADLIYLKEYAKLSPDRAVPGAVGTVVVLTSKNNKSYWESDSYTIQLAHVGDTRAILCDSRTGRAHRLTFQHNPTDFEESRRLRHYNLGFSSDSFGEKRYAWVANTRSFGDGLKLKRLGVVAEPQLTSIHSLRDDWSFLTLLSDGVTQVVSDDEVVDIIKLSESPQDAANNIIRYAQNVGSVDDITCLVIRLPGWKKRTMNDFTKNLRLEKSFYVPRKS